MASERHKPRVLLAVEPQVLSNALATVLTKAGDEVIVLEGHEPPGSVAGDYDAAVVTIVLPDDVHADVVIELPDHEGNPGRGTVRKGGATRDIQIDSLDDLLGLLDLR